DWSSECSSDLFFSCFPRSELHVFKEIFHALEPALGPRRLIAALSLQGITQFAEQLALPLGQINRGFQYHAAQQVAGGTTTHRDHSLATQAQQFAGLGSVGSLQLAPAVQSRHLKLATQGRFDKVDRHLAIDVLAIALEDPVFAPRHHPIEVAGASTVDPAL